MKAFFTGMATTAMLATAPAAAQTQAEDRVTLNILRECAQIADIVARVSCYDRNIGVQIAQPVDNRPTGFGANQLPQPSPAQSPAGFGANQLPRPAAERAAQQNSLTATITAATQRAPGIWLLTLEDGAQWEFVDAVSMSYDPPRKGQVGEITAASMGSYIMRLQGQQGVRIRRVK